LVTVLGSQIERVDPPQISNLLERRRPERRLVLQSMQCNALEQIPQRQIEILGQSLQHLEQPLLQPDAGLDALHDAERPRRSGLGCRHGRRSCVGGAEDRTICGPCVTDVHWYLCTSRPTLYGARLPDGQSPSVSGAEAQCPSPPRRRFAAFTW